MSIFKNATQIYISESLLDIKSWISDEEIAKYFFKKDNSSNKNSN